MIAIRGMHADYLSNSVDVSLHPVTTHSSTGPERAFQIHIHFGFQVFQRGQF